MIVYWIFRGEIAVFEERADRENVTPADYAVEVRGLPEDAQDEVDDCERSYSSRKLRYKQRTAHPFFSLCCDEEEQTQRKNMPRSVFIDLNQFDDIFVPSDTGRHVPMNWQPKRNYTYNKGITIIL